MRGVGFKDKELPLLWHRLAKENAPVGLLGAAAAFSVEAAEYLGLQAISKRIEEAQFDILGGQVSIGDSLFVTSLQKVVDQQIGQLNIEEPAIADFFKRFNAEFPTRTITYVNRSADALRVGHAARRSGLSDAQRREVLPAQARG